MYRNINFWFSRTNQQKIRITTCLSTKRPLSDSKRPTQKNRNRRETKNNQKREDEKKAVEENRQSKLCFLNEQHM